jgi:hypothetical protein
VSKSPHSQQTRDSRTGAWPRGRRWSCVGTLMLVVGSASIAAAAQGGPGAAGETPDRIAVMPLEIVGDIPAGRPALEAAVMRGLTVAAAPTLPAGEAEARLRTASAHAACDSAECWSSLGRTVEARYLITGKIERKENFFQVEFKLVDARPGRLVARESNRCAADDCSVAELCRLVVRELARQNLTQPDELPSIPLAAATEASAEPLSSAAPGVDAARQSTPVSDRNESWWTPRRKWAVAAILGGLAFGAGGAFLVHYHNTCATRWQDETRECITLRGSDKNEALIGGIASAAVGAGLATTGVAMLLTARRATGQAGAALTLSAAPGSLFLSGRF